MFTAKKSSGAQPCKPVGRISFSRPLSPGRPEVREWKGATNPRSCAAQPRTGIESGRQAGRSSAPGAARPTGLFGVAVPLWWPLPWWVCLLWSARWLICGCRWCLRWQRSPRGGRCRVLTRRALICGGGRRCRRGWRLRFSDLSLRPTALHVVGGGEVSAEQFVDGLGGGDHADQAVGVRPGL